MWLIMDCGCNKAKNCSIMCTVDSCKHHCDTEQYCSLSSIKVGTHEPHPTECQCVDCNSFELK